MYTTRHTSHVTRHTSHVTHHSTTQATVSMGRILSVRFASRSRCIRFGVWGLVFGVWGLGFGVL